MERALIINEGYSNNFGDQAINKAMEELLNDYNYDTSFLHFSNPSLTELPNYKYQDNQLLHHKSIKKNFITKLKSYVLFILWFSKFKDRIIQNLRENKYDLIVIGGGQLVISSGSFALSGFSITMFWYTFLIKKYTKAKLLLVGVGSSKKFNRFETLLYKYSLKRFDKIWVRDFFSQKTLFEKFRIHSKRIPDVAFYLKSNTFAMLDKNNLALIGIASFDEVFARYNNVDKNTREMYYDKIYLQIKEYQKLGSEIMLFYTTQTDALECSLFNNYIRKKHNVFFDILQVKTLEDLRKALSKTKHVYSGRMHALILGLKSNCNVKAFGISQKLESFEKEYLNNPKDLQLLKTEILNSLKEDLA